MAIPHNLTTNSLAALVHNVSKLPHKKIAKICSALIIVYIAYLIAQATWFFMDDNASFIADNNHVHQSSYQESNTDSISVNVLKTLNLFGIYQKKSTKTVETIEIQNAPETQLNLTLAAAVASDEVESSAAIIEYKGKQETYGVGDIIIGTKASLERVLIDRVLIKRSGKIETLMLDGFDYKKSASVIPTNKTQSKKFTANKNSATIDKRSNSVLTKQAQQIKNDINKDPSKIIDYLNIKPQQLNGTIVGYQLSPGKKPEFFRASGLKLGDIAVQMNGYDLTQPSEAAQALNVLKQESEISLLVKRKNEITEILFSLNNEQ